MGEGTQDKDTPPARVGVREFRGNMTGYLRQAREGASFLITSHNEVLAELHPPSSSLKPPRRLVGAMHGGIWMADDFDMARRHPRRDGGQALPSRERG